MSDDFPWAIPCRYVPEGEMLLIAGFSKERTETHTEQLPDGRWVDPKGVVRVVNLSDPEPSGE